MQSTRSKLIRLLANHRINDGYISGEDLSTKLNITRSAIWKHMSKLKKDGYVIEGKARKGYRIIAYPDKLSENTIKWGLKTKWLGQTIYHYEQTKSTQIDAHQFAKNSATHGTIVIADEQTKSKGRMARPWISKKGKGLWMSIILRPNILPYQAPQLTLLTATVLADVIDHLTNITPQIKWPNDVLINDKKVSGILTEMQAEQDIVKYIVVGIGINVNQDQTDFPKDIRHKTTSIGYETNKKINLLTFIQPLLETFERKYEAYLIDGFSNIKKEWESYGFKLGHQLEIRTNGKKWIGTFVGIAEDGALLAKDEQGQIQKIYSSEIKWF